MRDLIDLPREKHKRVFCLTHGSGNNKFQRGQCYNIIFYLMFLLCLSFSFVRVSEFYPVRILSGVSYFIFQNLLHNYCDRIVPTFCFTVLWFLFQSKRIISLINRCLMLIQKKNKVYPTVVCWKVYIVCNIWFGN